MNIRIPLYSFKLVIVLLLLVFVSCRKEKNHVLEIKVLSLSDNKPVSTFRLSVFSEVGSKYVFQGVTTEDGLVSINIEPEKKYNIVAGYGQGMYIANQEAHYIADGIFDTYEELLQGPHQNSQVGGVKYHDLNADGVVEQLDQVVTISSSSSDETIKTTLYLKNYPNYSFD